MTQRKPRAGGAPPGGGAGTLLPVALDTYWQVRHELEQDLQPAGLTIAQYVTLVQLAVARHEVGMSDLARAGRHDPATATVLVDGLVRRGLVVRRRAQIDRRRVGVRLTARGRRVYQTATRRLIIRWRRALRSFAGAEQIALLSLLLRLLDGLQTPEAA
jgi:DNA-binding MarR family transcriptional regulator